LIGNENADRKHPEPLKFYIKKGENNHEKLDSRVDRQGKDRKER
jgi:hypothetical protein